MAKNIREISEFLSFEPLYKRIPIDYPEIWKADGYSGITFDFYCKKCEANKTFELTTYPQDFNNWAQTGRQGNYEAPLSKDMDGNFSLTQHYKGICKACTVYSIDIILQSFLGKNQHDVNVRYVRKVGQFPPFEIKPDKYILKYLDEANQEYYKTALKCLSKKYGIGAFAYFRRIEENLILLSLTQVAELNESHKDEINISITKYNETHQMSTLISDNYKYFPHSITAVFNVNPLSVIHEKLSIGIHKLTDDECFNIANDVSEILKYLSEELYKDKFTVPQVKGALKELLKNQS